MERDLLWCRAMLRLSLILLCLSVACSTDEPNPGEVDASPGQADASPNQADASPGQADASQSVADCQINAALQWHVLAEVVQMKSADGSKCAVFERRNDCPPSVICMAVPFTILEARIGANGQVHTQTDTAKLKWEPTHHNWSDYAEVDVDGVHYRLDCLFGDPGYYDLTATDIASGNTMWGPVQLDPVNPR